MRSRFAARCVLALTFACIGFPAAVSAQSNDPYNTELVEWTIEVSGPEFVLDSVALEEYPNGKGERIYFSHVDSLAFAEVSFFDDTDTPEQTIALNLDAFADAAVFTELIASGNEGEVFYALLAFSLDAERSGIFYIEVAQDVEGEVDLVQSIYTLNTGFPEQLQVARQEISLDGNAFLGDPVIDMEAAIAGWQSDLVATPEATPVSQNTPAGDPAHSTSILTHLRREVSE